MLVDLHCHTSLLSTCSAVGALEYARLAHERGLDAICLTEHDRLWAPDALAQLREQLPIPVFAGVEVTTDAGHILVYGLAAGDVTASFRSLADAAERCGAVLFLAHPARDGLLRLPDGVAERLTGVEVVNGSDTAIQDAAAGGIAGRFARPGIGGSDAHTAAEVGGGATRFAARFEDNEGLVAALRSGDYAAVRLTVRGPRAGSASSRTG